MTPNGDQRRVRFVGTCLAFATLLAASVASAQDPPPKQDADPRPEDVLERASCEHLVTLLEDELGDRFEPALFPVEECVAEWAAVEPTCSDYEAAVTCTAEAESWTDAVEGCRMLCGRMIPEPDAGAPSVDELRPVCQHMVDLAEAQYGQAPASGLDDCVAAIRGEWAECVDGPGAVECIRSAESVDDVMDCERYCAGEGLSPDLPRVEE